MLTGLIKRAAIKLAGLIIFTMALISVVFMGDYLWLIYIGVESFRLAEAAQILGTIIALGIGGRIIWK